MGVEHLAAVWDLSRQSGSRLVVLLAIANYSDHNGEWVIDQPTLQRRTRLSSRYVREVLSVLVDEGELAVVSHHGRGKLSTYRLLVGQENWRPGAAFPTSKEEGGSRFSWEKAEAERQLFGGKVVAESQFSEEKAAPEDQFSGGKPEVESQFSAPLAPPSPPFPPDPLYPLIPLTPPEQQQQKQETFGLRPLSGPQSAVFRVNLMLEEAGIALPSPAQVGLWSKTLGGPEPLLDLLGRLVQAGLANKRQPLSYVHRVVMERSAKPESGRPLDARAGRELLRAAGADEIRSQQALEIIANTEES